MLEQSDATGWMGMFCLNLMRIALELARGEPGLRGHGDEVPPALRLRCVRDEEHGRPRRTAVRRARTASSTTCCATPTAASQKFRVRSLVGLIPLFAVERLELEWIEPFKEFTANLNWFLKNRRHLVDSVIHPLERPDGKTNVPAHDRRHRAAAPVARPRARRARVPVALRHPLAIEAARGAAVRVGRSPRHLRARRVGRETCAGSERGTDRAAAIIS